MYDLCQGVVFFQTSSPFSADFKAFSTSSGDAFEARPKISSFEGFITSYVSPLEDLIHLPSIN